MKQVLILNITRMGDLVQMGPLLERLHEEWPDVQIDLVVDRRFAAVAALLGGLREVLTFDFHDLIDHSRAATRDVVALYDEFHAWAGPLRERRYDRAVNLTFNQPSTFLASYVAAPDLRGAHCGWDGGTVVTNPWMAYFTDIHRFRRVNRFNLVDVYALGGSGPGRFAPLKLTVPAAARTWAGEYLRVPADESGEWIAVQAGASDVMKAWRPEHFGVTLARVSGRWSGGLLFIGTQGEQQTIARVVQVYKEAGGKNVIKNAAGQTSLEQLTALLAQCRLLLTNDTGPMHLAVAVGTPVIDLSVGHVDFRETGPYGQGHWVIQPELDCAPCSFEQVCAHHSCKDRIPSESVAELILHQLDKADRPAADPGFRLYRSDVDEDQLGTFRLVAGAENPMTAWYGTFWRRFWYERFTNRSSRVPEPTAPPPDASEALASIDGLQPILSRLCRRADDVVRVAAKRTISVKQVHQLQQDQRADRERAAAVGLASFATSPATVAFLRTIQGDDVQGLDRLARYHADAYREWAEHVAVIKKAIQSKRPPGTGRDLHVIPARELCAEGGPHYP